MSKFLNTKKEPKGYLVLRYAIPKGAKDKAIHDLEKVRQSLPSQFTFQDILKVAADTQCMVDLSNFVDDTFGIPWRIQITLDYTYGNLVGKRLLFDRMNIQTVEKQAT